MNKQTFFVVDGSFHEDTKTVGMGLVIWDGECIKEIWEYAFVYAPYSQIAEYKAIILALKYMMQYEVFRPVLITDQKNMDRIINPARSFKNENKEEHWTKHPEIQQAIFEMQSLHRAVQKKTGVNILHRHKFHALYKGHLPQTSLYKKAHALSRLFKTKPTVLNKLADREKILLQQAGDETETTSIHISYLQKITNKTFLYIIRFKKEIIYMQKRTDHSSFGLLKLASQYQEKFPSATVTIEPTKKILEDIPLLKHLKKKNKFHLFLEKILEEKIIQIKKAD